MQQGEIVVFTEIVRQAMQLVRAAGATELGLIARALRAHPDPSRLSELARAVAGGELLIPIVRRMPLEEIREAQRQAERGAGDKIVIRVH
jgi:hypothetical protein